MVGRLVQNEEIDLIIHQHAKTQAALLTAGEDGDGFHHILAPEFIRGQAVSGALGAEPPLGGHHVLHQVPVRMVEMDDLGQIGRADLRAGADPSVIGIQLAHDHFNKGGFAGAVVTDEGNALASLHLQGNAVKQMLFAKGLGQIPHGKHFVAMEFRGVEPGVHLPGLGGLGCGAHPLDTPLHGDGAAVGLVHALEGPEAKLLRRMLQLLDLGLLLQVLLHALLIAALLFHGVKAVVSAVKLRLAVLDLNDPGDDAVQEIAVMGNGHHSAPETADVLLQPLRGVEVQMVGRLVQQQDVRILQDEAAQVHPGLLTARELVEELCAHVVRDGKAVCDLVDGDIRIVAAKDLKPLAELSVPAQDGVVGLSRRHPLFQFLHFLRHGVEPGKGAAQHILHRVARGIHRDLGDEAHAAAGADGDRSLIIVQFSGQNLEKGGFSRAIAAQEANPFALIHLKGQTIQDVLSDLKGFDQAVYLNLNHKILSAAPPGLQNAWRGTP